MFFRSSLGLKPVVLSGRPNLISRLDQRQPNPILNRILFILPASGSWPARLALHHPLNISRSWFLKCKHLVSYLLLGQRVISLIHVYFDCSVPASRNHSVILSRVPNKRNLTLLRIMLIQLECVDAWKQIKNLHFALVRAHNQLPVMTVELHARNIAIQNIFHYSDWLSRSRIPHLDWAVACHIDLKSYLWKFSTRYWIIVRILSLKRLIKCKNFKFPAPKDQLPMFLNRLQAGNLLHILHIERLIAAIVEQAPHLDHAFSISGHKLIRQRQTRDSDQGMLMTIQFHYLLL